MGRRAAHLYKWPTGQKPILDADSPWQDKQLIYDGYKLVEERYLSGGNAGKLIRRYYYEPGINKLATVEVYEGAATAQHTYIPLTDDRGALMGVINDATGQIIEKLHYNSTGLCKSYQADGTENYRSDVTTLNLGRSAYIPFGWCGMYRDQCTGKYHTHYRNFDPVHNRRLSEDPAGYADGLNLYAAYMGVNGIIHQNAVGLA